MNTTKTNPDHELERFDRAMRGVLALTKADLQRRLEQDRKRTRVGLKRGPKSSASPAPAAGGQN